MSTIHFSLGDLPLNFHPAAIRVSADFTLASGHDCGGVTRAAKGRKRTSCCPTDMRAGSTPIPRQQFVEFLDGMFGDAGQDVGKPGVRIDVVHLGGLCRAPNYAERVRFP